MRWSGIGRNSIVSVARLMRSRRVDPRLQRGEADGMRLGGMGAEDGVLDGPEVATVRELRVVVEVAEVLDRRGVHPRGLQAGGDVRRPLLPRPFFEPRLDVA